MPFGFDYDKNEAELLERIFPNSLVYYREIGSRFKNDYEFYDKFKVWTMDNDFCSFTSCGKEIRLKYSQIINGVYFDRVHLSHQKNPQILVFDYDKANFGIL